MGGIAQREAELGDGDRHGCLAHRDLEDVQRPVALLHDITRVQVTGSYEHGAEGSGHHQVLWGAEGVGGVETCGAQCWIKAGDRADDQSYAERAE
jgi:hypothetical protein